MTNRSNALLQALVLTVALSACEDVDSPTTPPISEGGRPSSYLPSMSGDWTIALLRGRFSRPAPGQESCDIPELEVQLVQEVVLSEEGLRAARVGGSHNSADFVCSGDRAMPLPPPFERDTLLHLARGALSGSVVGFCNGSATLSVECSAPLQVAVQLAFRHRGYEIVLYGALWGEDDLRGTFRMSSTGYQPMPVMDGLWQATRRGVGSAGERSEPRR